MAEAGKVFVRNGRFEDAANGRAEMKAYLKAWRDDPAKPPLVVHFHGGLVSRAAGMEIADRLGPIYREAGGTPVFFVWQSMWDEQIRTNLDEIVVAAFKEIVGEKVLAAVLKKALKLAASRLGLDGVIPGTRAVAGLSDDEIDAQIDARLASPAEGGERGIAALAAVAEADTSEEPFQEASKAANRSVDMTEDERQALAEELMSDEEVGSIPSPEPSTLTSVDGEATRSILGMAAALASITFRTVRRFSAGRDHGLYHTVLEETAAQFGLTTLGRILQWDLMKKDTADAFATSGDVCAGSALIEELDLAWRADPSHRIVLIGHSTGAVYINNLLSYAESRLPANAQFDVVLLAPACTFDTFRLTAEKHAKRIKNVRLFGMRDTTECADQVAPPLYQRSLLYLVSGCLEDERDKPILGMQRFFANAAYDGDESVVAVREYFRDLPNWQVWSKTDVGSTDGLISASLHHGDFDNEESTLASLGRIIRVGYA